MITREGERTKAYMKICHNIAKYFDKYGFPSNFDENDKTLHLTINWCDQYVIDVRPYQKTEEKEGIS